MAQKSLTLTAPFCLGRMMPSRRYFGIDMDGRTAIERSAGLSISFFKHWVLVVPVEREGQDSKIGRTRWTVMTRRGCRMKV